MTREDLLAVIVAKGVAPEDADVCIDLAQHAANEAVTALIRVTDASEKHSAITLLLAAAIVVDHFNEATRRTNEARKTRATNG